MITPKAYCRALKFINPISFQEIFENWKELEAWQDSWKKHWEDRGYSSWEEWRNDYVKPLDPLDLEWFLYSIKDPIKFLPEIYGVPSRTWTELVYKGAEPKQLKDVLDHPIVTENPKIIAIKNSFPKKTMLTGIIHANKIFLVEGMHRACALAGWDKDKCFEGEVTIALALFCRDKLPILGGNSKK